MLKQFIVDRIDAGVGRLSQVGPSSGPEWDLSWSALQFSLTQAPCFAQVRGKASYPACSSVAGFLIRGAGDRTQVILLVWQKL